MTNPINLLNNNDNLSLDQIMAEIRYNMQRMWSLNHAMHEARLTVADLAVVNQLIDTYGVSYRGAAALREYLETREELNQCG